MNTPRNVFIFDVDGTLMKSSGNKLDEESIVAIHTVSKYGEVLLASARPLNGILNLLPPNSLNIEHIIALNGAITYSNSKINVSLPIDREAINFFYTHINKYINIWFYSKSSWYSNNLISKEYFTERNAVTFDAVPINNFTNEDILKIVIIDDSSINFDIKELEFFSNKLEITRSNNSYIEINTKNTNKYNATKTLFSGLNVRFFSFGDSNNDEELMKHSYFSCAVANSNIQVKAVSKFISQFTFGKGVLDSVYFIEQNILKI